LAGCYKSARPADRENLGFAAKWNKVRGDFFHGQ